MATINNMRGDGKNSSGKIIYSEELSNGLFFLLILRYNPLTEKSYRQSQPCFEVDCVITDNKTVEVWGNGVTSVKDNPVFEVINISKKEKFPPIKPSIKTKDGFIVYQREYNVVEFSKDDSNKCEIKYKSRYINWLIDISKEDLIELTFKKLKLC